MEYGLVGKDPSHTYAKEFHESLNDITYEIKALEENEFIDFIKSKNFKGINVTIPYKETVIPYLDEISETAKQIGAVNVVINDNGRLKGYNVDLFGLTANFKHNKIDIEGKNVLILGTGGTSNTAEYACKTLNAKSIYKASRHPNGVGQVSYEDAYTLKDINVIINTTPVGMAPHVDDDVLIDLEKFPTLEAVVDCIYNPFKTNILIKAKELGLKYANGLMMMVAQGIKTDELFFNKTYDKRVYLQTYLSIVANDQNIVLIGLPGSGKRVVGTAMSDKLGVFMLDVDTQMEKKKNAKFFDLLLKHNEKYFRDLETRTIKDLAMKTGKIITTGGGVVLRERNIKTLEKNSIIIYVYRDLDKIKKTLTSDESKAMIKKFGSLKKMYEHRDPLYRKHADYVIKNNGKIDKVANKVIRMIMGDPVED